MIVSEVGRTANLSLREVFPPMVTQATSGANPSIWVASFFNKDSGINSGKYAFFIPIALNFASVTCTIFSHKA